MQQHNRSCSTAWWQNDYRLARCFRTSMTIVEPIISVQEQRQTRAYMDAPLRCKSNYTDQCYAEYNIRGLRQGFGQLKDVHFEKNEPGKPSLIVHSPEFDKSDDEIAKLTDLALKALEIKEMRKRFALIHTSKSMYLIGGYLLNFQEMLRIKPTEDYRFDVENRRLVPIPAIPNGSLGFGLCCDGERLFIGFKTVSMIIRLMHHTSFLAGGHDLNNRALVDCYTLNLQPDNERWTRLPDLPAPTTGPGLGIHNGELHCVGGFDVLNNHSIAHGEYLLLDYRNDRQWRYGSELHPPRARPIVMIIPDHSIHGRTIYVAGGFNSHPQTLQTHIVPDLQVFDETTNRWQELTIIPHLQLSHVLSFSQNKLYVNEVKEGTDDLAVSKILRSFDLQKKTWTEGHDEPKKPPTETPSTEMISPINTNLSPKAIPSPITKQSMSQTNTPMKNQQVMLPKQINSKLKMKKTK